MNDMTKAYINFNENYNCKLWCQYFTTIRSVDTINEKGFEIGDIVDIQKDHITMFRAEITDIYIIDLDNMSKSTKTLLSLDVGCNWIQAVGLLNKIYKSNIVAVITLLKK